MVFPLTFWHQAKFLVEYSSSPVHSANILILNCLWQKLLALIDIQSFFLDSNLWDGNQ